MRGGRCVAYECCRSAIRGRIGGDQDALAAAIGGQCPADDLLGDAEAVDRRGIYQMTP